MSLPSSKILSLFTLALCVATAAQQAPIDTPLEYTAREWHDSDGLPSEEIDSMMMDEQGYLWIAGNGKLARFDGTSFETFKIPSEIRSGSLSSLHHTPGAKTSILIAPFNSTATPQAGIRSPNTTGYTLFQKGTFTSKPEPALTGNTVRTTYCDMDGVLWLGCDDGTVLRCEGPQRGIFLPPQGGVIKRPPVFATDQTGRVWSVINDQLVRFDGTGWTLIPETGKASALRLVSSRIGGPWLITADTVYKWSNDRFTEIATLSEEIGAHYIQTAIEDRHGDLWFGTRSHGLFHIVKQEVFRIPTSHSDITVLTEDPDGNVWVGTNGGGLIRLKTKTFWLYNKTSGLSDDFSNSVSQDNNGAIWLANRDGGVARIEKGQVDPISNRANWRKFSAISVYPAVDGGMWITTGIGVFRTRPDNPEFLDRVSPLANTKSVRVTFAAHNGDYWLAVDPDQLLRLRDGKVASFGRAQGIDAREIRAITEDPSGVIWVGAAEGRLFRNHAENFERVNLPPGEDYGTIQALWFESDGTLLVGTTRKGILIISPNSANAPRILSTKQGLPNSDIANILRDDADRYWFASRSGIFSIQGSQLRDFAIGKLNHVHTIVIGKDYGLPQLSGLGRTQPSAWKAQDGSLWFATRKGVVRVDPRLASDLADPAPATIVEVSCDGILQSFANQLKIKSTVRKTEIRFSVLSLSVPEQTLIRYRLEGFDNDWVSRGNNRTATYPRLPPGTYVLYAEVSSGADNWNYQRPLLTIIVVSPWWQNTIAQLSYIVILVLGASFTVRFWSYRRLRGRLEQAEREKALEYERTRIARDIHDELGASLTRISLITQSAQHKNPSYASELEEIFETVRDSTSSLDEIVWAVNPKWDDAENLVSYLGNYAQRFLATAGLHRQLNLPTSLPAIKLPSQARHTLFLCCKESLNNIVKHAHAKEVALTLTTSTSLLRIEIADDGIGLDNLQEYSNGKPPRISKGNGLFNMQARMEEMGGAFKITTQSKGGTVVTLELPLPIHIRSKSTQETILKTPT